MSYSTIKLFSFKTLSGSSLKVNLGFGRMLSIHRLGTWQEINNTVQCLMYTVEFKLKGLDSVLMHIHASAHVQVIMPAYA